MSWKKILKNDLESDLKRRFTRDDCHSIRKIR